MHNKKIRLGVNIDHVATVRNARGGDYPCPLRAAILASNAGADGITAHLREDRRHISDFDIDNLIKNLDKPLNLEIAATQEMLDIARRHKPHAVCLVPEKREEKTTEGGLNIADDFQFFNDFIQKISEKGSRVSLFIDADTKQIDQALRLKVPVIELHTGSYCHAVLSGNQSKIESEYEKLWYASDYAGTRGLEVHAGHGISYDTVKKIVKIPHLAELNIGHFLIGEAIFIGLEQAIHKMIALISDTSESF